MIPRPFFLRRLSSRIARQISGEEREPVRPVSSDHWRDTDHLYGFIAGVAFSGIVAFALMAITWRPIC